MSMSKPQIPKKNTEKSNKWELTNLTDWFEDHNARNLNNPCPREILTCECSKEVVFFHELDMKQKWRAIPAENHPGSLFLEEYFVPSDILKLSGLIIKC